MILTLIMCVNFCTFKGEMRSVPGEGGEAEDIHEREEEESGGGRRGQRKERQEREEGGQERRIQGLG